MKNTMGNGEIRRGAMIAAVSDHQVASLYLVKTEELVARQKNSSPKDVRAAIARSLKISASAMDFIRRQRRKVVPASLKESIVSLFIETAQAELRAIEHEIDIARQIGLGNGDGSLIEARTRAAHLLGLIDSISLEVSGKVAQNPSSNNNNHN